MVRNTRPNFGIVSGREHPMHVHCRCNAEPALECARVKGHAPCAISGLELGRQARAILTQEPITQDSHAQAFSETPSTARSPVKDASNCKASLVSDLTIFTQRGTCHNEYPVGNAILFTFNSTHYSWL